ncbi:MAG: isocitrate lyase/phosphoenolpyruvate mutase family protein [Actinobacteria bacterium]|nr:isocitrate lyase/phosphoenolpyruvate mutase family protein [Actinomycetota bacterium]
MRDPAALRALHVPGTPLVLPNAWDAASARAVVEAGFPVVATTSAGVARSLGFDDGEAAPVGEMVAAIARIISAADVPVTADFEGGYGLAADEIVRLLVGAGASGCNFEDSDHRGSGVLVDLDAQAERIAGLRAACLDQGTDLVINARIDVYVRQVGEPAERAALALERARAYVDAGADCVFPIGISAEADITTLVEGAGAPVNVYMHAGSPPLLRLAELGIARVSFGSALMRASMNRVRDLAEAIRRGDASGLFGP